MDENEFLKELINNLSDGYIINIGFQSNLSKLNNIDNLSLEELVLIISQAKFSENMKLFSNLLSNNHLKAIISLPIYQNEDNLIVLIFNLNKTSDKFILIDESSSLIHKYTSDWTYVKNELIEKISNSYNAFENSSNAVISDISLLLDNIAEVPIKPSKKPSKYAKLLELRDDEEDISPRKNRVIPNEIPDELIKIKQKQALRDNKDESLENPLFNELLYLKNRQDPENLLFKDNKRLIDGEVKFRKLSKIADLQNIDVKNDKNTILIATPKKSSQMVFYNHDVSDFNGEVYVELDNINSDVLKDYLYEYLNSTNDLHDLMYYTKGSTHISSFLIKNLKIPIPPINIQKEIVKVSRECREFFKTVDLLKKEYSSNIFDYKHMKNSIDQLRGDVEFDKTTNEVTSMSRSLRHAYKGLIWPLAISYLSATKSGFESVEKKDNYLVLFEFIAAFNTIILLSGLPDDVYQKNFSNIWKARNINIFKSMTFAKWVNVSKNLSEVYKNNNFTSQLDEDLFELISSDKILDILEDVKNIRNDEAHGPQSNKYEADKIIEKLNVYLEDVFDILDIYSNYKLIYVTEISSAKQAFKHRVILLNGPCSQPIYDEIIFDNMLEKESLYLYNPKNNKKLLINGNFMKFKPVEDNKKRWALFIYYSCNKDEYSAFYKCFQSKEKDFRQSINSFIYNILNKSE